MWLISTSVTPLKSLLRDFIPTGTPLTVHDTARAEVIQIRRTDGGTVENVTDTAAVAGNLDPTYNSDVDPSTSVIKHVKTTISEQIELMVKSLDRLAFREVLSTNVPHSMVAGLTFAAVVTMIGFPDGPIHSTVEVAPPTHTGPWLVNMTAVSSFKMNVPFT